MATTAFEAEYQHRRRTRLRAGLAAGAALLAALVAAAWVSEAFPSSLAAGLPRVGEYFAKLSPELRWDALLSGPKAEGSVAY